MAAIAEQVARLRNLSSSECSVTPPVPKSVKVELHSGCNLRCRFCAVSRRAGRASRMDLSTLRRIAAELRGLGVERLGLFYMNEPFADDRLPEAIRIAKQECGLPYVFLTSNAVAATPERLRACFEAGLDSLKFAINFSGLTQFLECAGGSASELESIVRNVRSARRVRDEVARDTGRYCRLSASSLAFDSRQEERMASVLSDMASCVDEHYWLPLLGRAERAPADTSPDEGPNSDGVSRKAVPCWSLFTEAHISADGELSACCLDPSDRFAMGNLAQVSFDEAWHGPRFRALRHAHLQGDVSATACAQCIGFI